MTCELHKRSSSFEKEEKKEGGGGKKRGRKGSNERYKKKKRKRGRKGSGNYSETLAFPRGSEMRVAIILWPEEAIRQLMF